MHLSKLAVVAVAVFAAILLVQSRADEPAKAPPLAPMGESVSGQLFGLHAVANSKQLYVKVAPESGKSSEWLAIDAEKSPQLVTVVQQAITERKSAQIYFDDENRVTAAFCFVPVRR
jgi:hypothetical protein